MIPPASLPPKHLNLTPACKVPSNHFQDFYDRLRHHTGPVASTHDTVKVQNLHLLIPATDRSPEVCKLVLSAALAGYTTPTLISWNKTVGHSDWIDNGNRIGKITGILEYLDRIRPEENHDLLMVVDGYDTWLQLRPEVIIERYKQVNQQLYDRVARSIGDKGMKEGNIFQSIIFGASKTCGPLPSWNEYACASQPASTLAKNAYGLDTDTLDRERHLPYKYRPRWLMSGFMMGPAIDVRTMFERAREKITTSASPHKGSDQQILSGIFGEQEYYRIELEMKYRSWPARAWTEVSKLLGFHTPNVVDAHPNPRPVPSEKDTRRLDFGIGLDYEMQLVHSALYSDTDGEWVTMSDKRALYDAQQRAGIAEPALKAIPADVAVNGRPFDILNASREPLSGDEDRRLLAKQWSEVPLFTNLHAPSVPGVLHWNGANDSLSTQWPSMWFQKNARRLLQAYVNSQGLRTTKGGHRPLGAFTETGKWVPWSQLCDGFESELFGDGLGRFEYGPVEGYTKPAAGGSSEAT